MRTVHIPVDQAAIIGDLALPSPAHGVVLFAHGSGSGRHSSRNRFVASFLNREGFATLLIDLLTEAEERVDLVTRELRFDIGLLADRLSGAIRWLRQDPDTSGLPIGLFGASTGGAAALVAAVSHSDDVRAVVSRGGRPDLAGAALAKVQAPTLLIVGSLDHVVIELNKEAASQMSPAPKLVILPEATHLFEEPGKLEEVARLAADWYRSCL